MDDELILAGVFKFTMCAYAIARIIQKKRRVRQFKVRPINRTRRITGNFKYYQKMKTLDEEQFFKYTRMTLPVFEELLNLLRSHISKSKRSDGIEPEERLVLTLQYLSQGTSMQSLAWNFNMGLTTVHTIIHTTCKAIWDVLSPIYLKAPENEENWGQIAENFLNRWNFPHCLGAIDGKHVTIQAPPGSGSLYFNYKKTFSIVLLAACDANYLFTLVDIGAYGSQSDGGIFRNSIFGQQLQENNMKIPASAPLPGMTKNLPYFFVADEAIPLKEFIMRPFPFKNLSLKKRVFNYRLSRARQVIENTFGILVARWRILKNAITAKVDNVDNIVKATVVLHNFCKIKLDMNDGNRYCPMGYVDSNDDQNGGWRSEQTPLLPVQRLSANIAKRELYAIRESLADYFMSDIGKVSWQEASVQRGK